MSVLVCTPGSAEATREEVCEALTLGQQIASARGVELRWLVLGALPSDAAEAGAARGVAAIDHAADADVVASPDAAVATFAQQVEATSPWAVVVAQTFEMKVIAPRVAARLGKGIVVNAVAVAVNGETLEVRAASFGGDTQSRSVFQGAAPYFVSVNARSVVDSATGSGSAPVNAVAVPAVDERVKVLEPAKSEGPRLEDASIVVSGGRGLGDVEQYGLIEELAKALGGLPAASRPLVDVGWVDSSKQVGLTGRITKPELYIAIGISGASQHMAGCSAAKVIVAINKDENAPIYRHAKYGIIADFADIMPALIKAAGG